MAKVTTSTQIMWRKLMSPLSSAKIQDQDEVIKQANMKSTAAVKTGVTMKSDEATRAAKSKMQPNPKAEKGSDSNTSSSLSVSGDAASPNSK